MVDSASWHSDYNGAMLNASTPRVESSPWRTLRPHWLTWTVGGVTTLALVLIMVPGVYVEPTLLTPTPHPMNFPSFAGAAKPPQSKGPLRVAEYEHGWPWTYVRRAKGFDGQGWPQATFGDDPFCKPWLDPNGIIIWWSVPDAWPLQSDAAILSVGPLVGDFAVLVVLVAVVAIGCEFWLRRRGGVGRFKLIDAAVATVFIAAAITWWRWNSLETKENWEAIAVLRQSEGAISHDVLLHGEGMVGYTGVYWAYTGPEWLLRLIGSPEFMRTFLFRVEKIAIDTRYLNEESDTALCHLDDLEEIWIRGRANDLPPSLLSEFRLSRVEVATAYSGSEIPRYEVWVKK